MFLNTLFWVVFYIMILHFLSANIIYNKVSLCWVRLGQKVLKFEFAIEAIITFVKSIKKALSGVFTLLSSQ